MKPKSILMSSFGALLIMISVRESSIDFSKPNEKVTNVPPLAAIHKTSSDASHISKGIKDFNCLKYNVSDFVGTNAGKSEMPDVAIFDFLKFKVSGYFETETAIDALPEDSDFDFLKFDVNKYRTSTYDEEKLPLTNFDYLKFDVQKYVKYDSMDEINELPENDN